MRTKLLIIILAGLLLGLTGPALAATRTVTNCADSGSGSLRQALLDATTGDEIVFNITIANAGYSTGPQSPGLVTNEAGSDWWFRIMVAGSQLPQINGSNISIRGSTQPTDEANNTKGPEIEVRDTTGLNVYGFITSYSGITIEGMVINNFSQMGMYLQGNYHTIKGCYIGTTATGEAKCPNNSGGVLLSNGSDCILGGGTEAERNIISGNNNLGVQIWNCSRINVRGNYIGVGRDGLIPLANATYGIYLGGTTTNHVAIDSNVISGNANYGIRLYQATYVEIKGNKIGVKADGLTALPNGQRGIDLTISTYNLIGGTTEAERNLIAGQDFNIFLSNSPSNTIKGNYLGVGKDGATRISSFNPSLYNNGSNYTTIEGNVISGTNSAAVWIGWSSYCQVKGNKIGTNALGTAAISNGTGIFIYIASQHNLIGGSTTAEGNLISGNSGNGIIFNQANYNEIKGNKIGTNASGTSALPNYYGVYLWGNSSNITVESNTVAYNSQDGVRVVSGSSYVLISRNSMEANGGKGIYLESGANNNIVKPTIASVGYDSGLTTVTGNAPASAVVEVFKTEALPGGDGQGEGKEYLGSVTAAGDGSWIITVEGLVIGNKVTATATKHDATGGYTSEFAKNRRVAEYHPPNVVWNCDDEDVGSLRQVLANAEAAGGNWEIIFDITTAEAGYSSGNYSPGLVTNGSDTWFRIITNTPLRLTSSNVYIHGSTQTREAINSKGPEVEVRCSSGGDHNGLELYQSSNCTVEGLVINGSSSWPYNGIVLEEGGGHTIKGCYLGTNAQGNSRIFNLYGIHLVSSASNLIGGDTPAERNVISGNAWGAIKAENSSSNEVRGNYCGVGADGTTVLNEGGIDWINSSFNRVGPNNLIANAGFGVIVQGANSNYDLITQNTIEACVYQAIYLQPGANNSIPYPVITSATYKEGKTYLAGTSTPEAVIEIFKADDTPGVYDRGGARLYLATLTAEASGRWMATLESLSIGDKVTATATKYLSPGYTSEFSNNFTVGEASFSLVAPNGGETWRSGTAHLIKWNATGGPTGYRIYYTTGEAAERQLITSEVAGTSRSYWWIVPYLTTTEARVTMEADFLPEDTLADGSDGVFTITEEYPWGDNVVINCNDLGRGSLRGVLLSAEAVGGNREIIFDITQAEAGDSGGPYSPGLVNEDAGDTWFRIIIDSALPVAADNIYIHGSTQTQEANNTRGPKIEIRNRDGAGAYDGFSVTGSGCTLEGLVVNSFNGENRSAITIAGNRNNIRNCYIGEDAVGDGTVGAPWNYHGITLAYGANNNLIGGATPEARNLIGWNTYSGVRISGSGTNSNEVKGNYIGTGRTGTEWMSNGVSGVRLESGASFNQIGGITAGERNLLCGGTPYGVYLSGAGTDQNRIQGNYIGTDVTGTVVMGGPYGICLENGPQYNLIGGVISEARNIISGNGAYGVYILGTGTNSNEVKGNYIGVDVTGAVAMGNGAVGIYLENGPQYNLIGGATIEARNIISGNGDSGVRMVGSGTNSNEVKGNYIGTNVTGLLSIPNAYGVVLWDQPKNNIIGGAAAGEGNLISGNGSYGVYLRGSGTDNNRVTGNYIGVDITGNSDLGNGSYGVNLESGPQYNRIGERNVISGNASYGISISGGGTDRNEVLGNYIGTNVSGALAIPNDSHGLSINGGQYNRIGGTLEGESNILSGNLASGIDLSSANYNEIKGNYIGTGLNGESLGNAGYGINNSSSYYNVIGPGNWIAHNGDAWNVEGILIDGGSDYVVITQNTMEANFTKGITVQGNHGILPPVIGYAWYYAGTGRTKISGTCLANATVEVFKTEAVPGPDNQGEGKTYLGTAISNGSGGWMFETTGLALGEKVTATVTGNDGSGSYTSEFALNATVGAPGDPFKVTNTNNSGLGSLRFAIQQANLSSEANTITFNIPDTDPWYNPGAGTWKIRPDTNLPSLTDNGTYINGNSQKAWFDVDTNPYGPEIEIDGSNIGSGYGLAIYAADCTLEGLVINQFATGIYISGAGQDRNRIIGNYIGTDVLGTSNLGNSNNGVMIENGSRNNLIGRGASEAKNIISANGQFGVLIIGTGTDSNEVKGNFIGVDRTGAAGLGNGTSGVLIDTGPQYNLIGGATSEAGNVISANGSYGVHIFGTGTNRNEVKGNYIGVDVTGLNNQGNGVRGVFLENGPQYNLIGGLTSQAKNIISANSQFGVYIFGTGTDSNEVQGNYIGTDATGTAPLANGQGVIIDTGPQYNLIGGATPEAKNIISGNDLGLHITGPGTNSNEVQGNYIGLNVTGAAPLANGQGVMIDSGAQNNLIGGATPEARNIISGNSDAGVFIYNAGTDNNQVKGNYIGVDPSGTIDFGNVGTGVLISDSSQGNIIGAAGAGNVISGNTGVGVYIQSSGTNNNEVKGNYIGVNAAGTSVIPNNDSGVEVQGEYNRIGGEAPGEGNLISGNASDGVLINSSVDGYNEVKGNLIGTDRTGTFPIANQAHGVAVGNSSYVTVGPGNLIANNGADPSWNGVYVLNSQYVLITSNTMEANAGKGIYLGAGSNNDIPKPVITYALKSGSQTTVAGTSPDGAVIEVYKTEPVPGPDNQGEGKIYLATVTAEGTSWIATVEGLAVMNKVTATASLFLSPGYTSEFALNGLVETSLTLGVTLESPNGGETWEAFSSHNLTWETGGSPTAVNLYYSLDNGGSYNLIAGGETNDGSYLWKVPETPTTEAKIKIEALKGEDIVTDESDAVFTISSKTTPPLVTVQSPAGGEFWVGGTTHNIVFSATDEAGILPDSANLYYTTGEGWIEIITGQPTNSAYSWSPVPSVSSTEVKVRVTVKDTSAGQNLGTGESASKFTIETPGPYVVWNCNDTGPGSLRDVLASAEAAGGNVEITFAISTWEAGYSAGEDLPGLAASGSNTWFKIIVDSAELPTLTQNNIYIHGSTQTREALNTAGPEVEIRSKNGPNYSGLILQGNYCTVEGLAISGFGTDNTKAGIYLQGNSNQVTGCHLGATATGEGLAGNYNGIDILGQSNLIGGNVISGNAFTGIYIDGGISNEVKGNIIGLGRSGLMDIGNATFGIYLVNNAQDNTIGGAGEGERNIISGQPCNILINNASFNKVKGNYIGPNQTGTSAAGLTSGFGILFWSGASYNLIGGAAIREGNVISGHSDQGLRFEPTTSSNEVKGNYIGVDKNGAAALPNSGHGIYLVDSQFNIIGGTGEGERNIISGNGGNGVCIGAANHNLVQGNYIGLDQNGTVKIANYSGVVLINGAQFNRIGGTSPGEGNVISGNHDNGIVITDDTTINNEVKGNLIGTDKTGTLNKRNFRYGILVQNNSSYNQIGPANLIAFNGSVTAPDGVNVKSGSQYILITQNSMEANYGKGIFLEAGANNDIQKPYIDHACYYPETGQTSIVGTAKEDASVEVFRTEAVPGADNQGEGKTYLGTAISDGSGNWTFDTTSLATGEKVTATVTKYESPGYTSEFAQNIPVVDPEGLFKVINTNDTGFGSLRFAITRANLSTEAHTIIFNIPGSDPNYNAGTGTWMIQPLTNLPALTTNGTYINGNSQKAWYGVETNPKGPEIEINGGAIGAGNGLAINAADCTIEGLVINQFENGILISDPGKDRNQIIGNYIGTNVIGTSGLANSNAGVNIANGAQNNLIGGATSQARNLISANGQSGVNITGTGTDSNEVAGNYIGVDRTGNVGLANGSYGVALDSGPKYNLIGAGNVICSNGSCGVYLLGSDTTSNEVRENRIGLGVNGSALGNSQQGIICESAFNNQLGPNNWIAYNGTYGVAVVSASDYISITQNSMEANGDKGIYIEGGSNHDIPYPAIEYAWNYTATGLTRMYGTCWPNVSVEVFKTEPVPGGDDQGEGKTYLGTATSDSAGVWRFATAALAVGERVTATITKYESPGYTSEFAINKTVETAGATADVYVVTNCEDPGPGSLRSAIINANLSTEAATITFNIPWSVPGTQEVGGVKWWKIEPLTELPAIRADGTYLHGSSQKINYGEDTNPNGPEIELSGASCGGSGIYLTAANCTVEGLVINSFTAGIFLVGQGNDLLGNYIGTDVIGTSPLPNTDGVNFYGQNNQIGGAAAGERNLISGNVNCGFYMHLGADHNRFLGNYIGTDRTGSGPLPNGGIAGILMDGPCSYNRIGGLASGEGNVISANTGPGVHIAFGSNSNEVVGNYIGCGVDGNALGNGGRGVFIADSSNYNQVGPNNSIANNGTYGVMVAGLSDYNLITQNSMEANGDKGIYIEGGSNHDIAYPVIDCAFYYSDTGQTRILGSCPPNASVEVFKTEPVPGGDDQGEGKIYLGTTASNGSGIWRFETTGLATGERVTATASLFESPGYTSEFAINAWVQPSGASTDSFKVLNCQDTGAGSLRFAIINANLSTEANTIIFNIPDTDPGCTTEGAVKWWRIQPATALPTLKINGTYINGGSQKVFAGDTNPNGPEIELNGELDGGGVGLNVAAADCTIEGMVINQFNQFGISIGGNGNRAFGNYIGTDVNGTAPRPNSYGIYILGGQNNIIGGAGAEKRNVVSGNGNGFYLQSTSSNNIQGNYIGTDRTGSAALPNIGPAGMLLDTFCYYNLIGGAASGEGNVISGNSNTGIRMDSSCNSNEVVGNYIGLGVNRNPLGNGTFGVSIFNACSYDQIGPNNSIANNGTYGVAVDGTSDYILITRNSMEANVGKGIQLYPGANHDIPYPRIAVARYYKMLGKTVLAGTAEGNAVVEIFKTESTPGADDQGEGLVYLGSVTAEGSGNWTATISGLMVSDRVCATSAKYSSPGYTSEFSLNGTVEGMTIETTLETPNGGENWMAGTWHNITWEATDASSFNLYYTTSEARGYTSIASGLPGTDRSYAWFVPNTPTTEAKVRVQAVGSIVTDESDAVFTILGAVNYYVDAAQGSNVYDGLTTEVTGVNGPWKNISYAATQAAASSTIHVAAGTYNAATGESFPIRTGSGRYYISTTTGSATIDSLNAAADTVTIESSSTFEGFTVRNASGLAAYAAVRMGGSNPRLLNSRVYRTTQQRAVQIAGGVTNALVQGCTIESALNAGIAVNTDNTTNLVVRDNTLRADQGVSMGVSDTNFLVTGNKIISYHNDSNSYRGVFLSGSGSGTISYNEIRGYQVAREGAIFANSTSNKTANIEHNTIVKNIVGISSEGSAGGVLNIKNNIISAAPRPGSYWNGSTGIGRLNGTVNSNNNQIYNNENAYTGTVNDKTADLTTCPRFVDPDNHDYRLFKDSPCRSSADDGLNRGAYGTVEATSGIVTVSYVSPEGSDSNDGSLGSPFQTVSHAIANTLEKIYLRTGSYPCTNETLSANMMLVNYLNEVATIDSGTAANHTIGLGANSSIEGITIRSSCSGGDYYACRLLGSNARLLNCQLYGLGSGHLVYLADGTSNTLVRGNTLTNSYNYYGRGVYFGSTTNAAVEGNTIRTARGIYFSNAAQNNFSVIGNRIASKESQSIYGIYFAGGSGAGTVASNEISGYTYSLLTERGTGIYDYGSTRTVAIRHNSLVGNKIGIKCRGSVLNSSNNIVCGGFTGASSEAGLIREVSGTLNSSYDNVWNHGVNWSAAVTGVGTISADPKFADASGRDYHLLNNSPGIDSGDPAYALDPDGTRTDMGAYYFDQAASPIPAVYLKTPASGESLTGFIPYAITWYANHDGHSIDHIELYYSTDSGATYPHTITSNTANTGSFPWTVGNTPTTKARIKVVAVGSAGTDESDSDFIILEGDITPPTVEVTSPNGGEKWKGGTSHDITFTCTDEYGIQPNSAALYYSTGEGTAWIAINTGQATDAAYSWNPLPLISTNEVKVRVTARDKNSNTGTGESQATFIIDITPPGTSELIAPPNGSITNDATPAFSWTAATDNLSGIASYEIWIDSVLVTQDATTSYTTPDAMTEGVHNWKVKAKDGAGIWGNYSTTSNFTVDLTTPEVAGITLRDRTNGSIIYSRSLAVSVEANGATGNPVSMRMAQDAAFTENATAWQTYNAAAEYAFTAGEGSRTLYYKVRDAASNESSTVSNSIIVDTLHPSVESIRLRDTTNGSTLESNSLTVTLEAVGVSVESTEMRIAQDAAFTSNSTGWITYIPTAEYTFTAGEGARTAFYQVRDIASNESNITNYTITIDTSGPSASGITLRDRIFGSSQYANSLTISLEVLGAGGSPAQMRIAQDAGFTINDTGWLAYAATSEYTFTAGEGSRTAYYKMRDSAENESPTYNAAITIDTQPPSQVTLLSPADNTYTSDNTPTFNWNAATDTTSGVASYEIVIDTTQAATLGVTTTYTTPDAEGQGAHNWKVRAKDNAQNWGLYSLTWNLTVETTTPTVTLGKPNGGELLAAASSYSITWEASDVYGLKTDPITLYFSSNNGGSWSTIQSGITYVTGEGTYLWTVPNVNSATCRVSMEAEDKAGNKGLIRSLAPFTINNSLPSVTVTYPNGGEYFKGNTACNITWTATAEVPPVTLDLKYSPNSGSSWTTITTGEANDGLYTWITPLISSTACRISIEARDALGRAGSDQSNADFTISSAGPAVALIAPNGGESLSGLGGTYNVRWNATDPVGFPGSAVTLKYSIDRGATWFDIASGAGNTGSYAWAVPALNSSQCRVSLEVLDLVGYTSRVESADNFTIDSTRPRVVDVTPANGAALISVTSEVTVSFSEEMSREAVQNAFSLSASPPVMGTFGWDAGGTIVTFHPSAALNYNTTYITSLAASACDLAGNDLASAFASRFTTQAQGDSEKPHVVIQRVDAQGRAATLKSGDYIVKRPKFKGLITDDQGINGSTIKFYLDDVLASAAVTEISPTNYEVVYEAAADLSVENIMKHKVKLQARDLSGNLGEAEITELKVASGAGGVIGPVLSYPQLFRPQGGGVARIAYNLNADLDLRILMFDITGQNVWTARCLSGTEGGKAGYNEVVFDARSQLSGAILGNGIYVYKLVAGNKVIGTGYITIND